MQYFVYILYSDKHDKTYVGQTEDLERRIQFHNHEGIGTFTSKYRPWRLIHSETYPSRSEAMRREKWFKSGVGRDLLKKIKEKSCSSGS